jgi:hypothetical protein
MTTITLHERVDMKVFTAIMTNLDTYIGKIGGGSSQKRTGNPIETVLGKYFNHLDENGVGKTVYSQRTSVGKTKIGRFFAEEALSIQALPRTIRHTIAGELYWDCDIANCHPEIAYQLAQRHGIPTPYLENYIKNRPAVLAQVQEELGVTRDIAKQEFLRSLNAGEMTKSFESCQLLVNFFSETNKIRQGLKVHYPEFFESAEKKSATKDFYNPMGTGINYVFCHHENEILHVMVEEAEKLGLVVGVLMFDGLMIEKEGVAREFISNVYFKACSEAIQSQLGFKINFAIKDPDEAFEVRQTHLDKKLEGKPMMDVENKKLIDYRDGQTVVADKTVCSRYITPEMYEEAFGSVNKVLCVKGNMGCGKTFALIEKFKNNKVLIVSYRCSLDAELARRFDCKLYSDFNTSCIQADRLVVQIDSVWRVRGEYDLVILDEASYTQSHFFQFTKDKAKCLDALQHFCRGAVRVVALDALFQKRNLEWICEVVGTTTKPFVLENTFKVYKDYTCHIHKGNRFNFYSALKKAILNRKKVVVPSNSLEALKFIESNIKAEFPSVKLIVIDKDTENVDVNDWINYDIVCYTPTVEAGLSFEKVHFHTCIAYMTNQSNSPSNFAQMLFRNRSLIDREIIIISSQMYLHNNPTTEEDIISNLQNDIRACAEASLTPDYASVNFNPHLSGYNKHWFATKIGSNWDRSDFKGYVRSVLVQHGVEVFYSETDTEELDSEMKQHLTAIKKDADNREIQAIFEAKVIVKEDYERLKDVEMRRPIDDTRSIRRYECIRTYGRELTEEEFVVLYPLQSEFKNAKLIRAGRKAIIDKIIERGEGLEDLSSLSESERFIALNEGLKACKPALKPLFVSDLMSEIGFNLQEFLCGGAYVEDVYQTIDNEKLKSFMNKRIDTYMSLTRSKKDYITKIDNQIMKSITSMLRTCGISLKSRRVRRDGEREKEYTLESIFVNGFNTTAGLNGELSIHDFDWADEPVQETKKPVRLLQKVKA